MPDRATLLASYRAALCELACESGWQPLVARAAQAPGLVLSAWNPGSVPLPPAVNQARDTVL
nr:hypothetical protein [Planctomycetota bacterium]